MVLVCFWYGFGMVLVWFWYVFGDVFGYVFGDVMGMFLVWLEMHPRCR